MCSEYTLHYSQFVEKGLRASAFTKTSTTNPSRTYTDQYAHIEIVVAFFVVKLFSWLVITSYGAGVSGSKFGRNVLLGLRYLPIPTRAGLKSTRP